MRKLLTLFSIVFFLAVASVPKAFSQVELFGGYSHLGLHGTPSNIGSGMNGLEGSAYVHLLGPWGAEADLIDHYGVSPRLPSNGGTYYVPKLMELYGPRFTLALPRVHPYVHALFGSVHGVAIVPSGTGTAKVSESAFGMGLGGGVNARITRHLWVRLVQLDYIRAQFSHNAQNETRISAGLVFRFGNW